MAKSSIHFQGVKANSEGHNLRLNSNLDYVFTDLSHLNRNYTFTENIGDSTNAEHSNFLRSLVKEKTGRKAQDKAHMMQEGCFNFNPEHTDEEIKLAIESFCQQMNLKPVRLSIHRDEGHTKDEVRKLNLHGHLVVEWIDRETGKSHKWDKNRASEAQTILAECLGMERGKKSTKRHLNSLEYKIQQKEKEVEQMHLQMLGKMALDFLKEKETYTEFEKDYIPKHADYKKFVQIGYYEQEQEKKRAAAERKEKWEKAQELDQDQNQKGIRLR
jgi:hypothetical protein